MTFCLTRKRSWTSEQLIKAVEISFSVRNVLKLLGLREAGGNYDQVKKYIHELGLNTEHFRGMGWNKGLTGLGKPFIPTSKILIKNSTFQSYKLKNRLFSEKLKPEHCEKCGWNKKANSGHLPLELHHVNGNRHDNRIENLLILCPNCHSLEPRYRGRNIQKKKARVA